jgi:outer membrane protein assembly factor BamB
MLAGAGVVRLKPKDGGGWEETWKSTKLQLGDTTPLVFDDRVYTTDPRAGAVYCTDAKTGKPIWDEKIVGAKQTFSASPVAADGKIYTLTLKGTLTVFKAGGTEADILGTSEVGANCLATPAISGGAVFIRTDDLEKPANNFLLCVGKK